MAAATAVLVAGVDALVSVPVPELSAAQLQDLLPTVAGQLTRLQGWLSAASGQLSAATGGQMTTEDGRGRSVTGWLADTTRTAPGTAGSRLRTATALRDLPLIVQAVLDGQLTQDQAAVLARFVGQIALPDLIDSQRALVQVAAPRNPTDLAAWVRHQIATHCEPALDADAATGRARRYLQTSRDPDGTLRGRFVLAAEDSEALLTALEPLARPDGLTDQRSAGQRRADALVELCEHVLRHGDLPDAGGQRPQLSYVLPADWAARQHDRDRCRHCTRCPQHQPVSFTDTVLASVRDSSHAGAGVPAQPSQAGHPDTAGHPSVSRSPAVPAEHATATAAWSGPQTRARIEALLCDARLSRVLLDTTGQVTQLTTLTDHITPAQRRALAARDGGCTTRGCTRPPAFTDVHHLTHQAHGGTHHLDNLALLCRRHHLLWHAGKIHRQDLHLPWEQSSTLGSSPPQRR